MPTRGSFSNQSPGPTLYQPIFPQYENQRTSDERTPLIPPQSSETQKTRPSGKIVLLYMVYSLLPLLLLATRLVRPLDPMNPEERDQIRRQWEKERLAHQEWRDLAQKELGNWDLQREAWDQEREAWDQEREAWDQERKGWDHKAEEYERRRKKWQEEEQRHEEERRRNEKESKRLGLYWDDLESNLQCLSYGTREYTARLENIPAGYDGMNACTITPVIIHGITFDAPDHCESRGGFGIYGHWLVNHEPICTTYWNGIGDKGCTAEGSGLHRFDGRLENLQGGADWVEMCSTTPLEFRGVHAAHPNSCANYTGHGIYGIWEFEDINC